MNTVIVTTAPTTTPATFLADAAAGTVQFHAERGNGTFRKVHFLAEGTDERATAEWVAEQREANVTMRAIAAELHRSVPSVRRLINDLALTEEFEAMDSEELADLIKGAAEAETNGEAIDFIEDNSEDTAEQA